MKELELIIKPFESIGLLKFGMTNTQVRAVMKEYSELSTFKRDITSPNETDSYYNSCLFVGYNEEGIFTCAEVIDLEVISKDKILNILSKQELIKLNNGTYEIIDHTYFFDQLGILMSEHMIEGTDEIDNDLGSILIASKGEYAELKSIYKSFSN
jgi:hypothetical protein